MSEMIERVAKGIYGSVAMDTFNDLSDDELHAMARAAIEAMREPTEQMTYAVHEAKIYVDEFPIYASEAEEVWRVMIDAALSPSREDEGKSPVPPQIPIRR